MTNEPAHDRKTGSPWTDGEVIKLIEELTQCGELNAVDAIVWLRLELAQAKGPLAAPRHPK